MTAKSLSGMSDEYVACQFFVFHALEDVPYDGGAPKIWRTAKGADIYQFRCWRCGVIRYDVLSSVTGKLVERRYKKPKGYSSVGRFDGRRQAVVKEYLKRNHVKAAPKKRRAA